MTTNRRPRKHVSFNLNENSELIQSLMDIAHSAFSPNKDEREEALEILRLPSDCRKLKFDYIILSGQGHKVTLGATYTHHGEHHHVNLNLGITPYDKPHKQNGRFGMYHL